MATASAIPVQLQLTTRSSPPVQPVDLNTDTLPAIWRGEDVLFNTVILDPSGVCVNLENMVQLQMDIYPAPVPNETVPTNYSYAPFSVLPFPTIPPSPLITSIVDSWVDWVNLADWLAGNAQQAQFPFTWEQTLSLGLNGRQSGRFWFVIHGLTADNPPKKLTYGGGWLQVYETGNQDIYLPSGITPMDVPAGTVWYIEPNQQQVFGLPISIEGSIRIDGTLVQANVGAGAALEASLSPDTLSGTGGEPLVETSGSTVVTTTGGVGPYSYLWIYVSGLANIGPENEFGATTNFSCLPEFLVPNVPTEAVWICQVTDSQSNVVATNSVTVTLTYTP